MQLRLVFIDKPDKPPRLLCDAELYFDGGELAGMRLVGFSVWGSESGDVFVTFPARKKGGSYFDFLRAAEGDQSSIDRAKRWIVREYRRQHRDRDGNVSS